MTTDRLLPNGSLAHAWPGVNRCLGWGDAVARGVWFVGLEEHDTWNEQDVLSRVSERPGTFVPVSDQEPAYCGHAGATIRSMMARIASALSASFRGGHAGTDHDEYANTRLWRPGSGVCQANLFPLGKARWGDWPTEYQHWFGFTSVTEYREAVRRERLPVIRDCFAKLQPRAVVCFGEEGWPDFKQAFSVGGEEPLCTETAPHGKGDITAEFYRSGVSIIALTPFFARPMTVELAGKIANRLFELGVRLP